MRNILFAFAGGMLMGLTPAPAGAWYLAWIALVPLWLLLFELERQEIQGLISTKKLLIALAWGSGYQGLALFWITGIHPMTWMGVSWLSSLAIALFCWLFITLWGAALVVAWSALMMLLDKKKEVRFFNFINSPLSQSLWRVLIGVALWCGLEAFWSLGSLWWSSLSYTQSPHNLVILQLGQLSGYSTITASIVTVNGLIAEAIIQGKRQKVKGKKETIILVTLAFIVCFILHLIGFGLFNRPVARPTENAIKVGIIQGNIPNEIKLYPTGWHKAIEGYTRGYKTLAQQKVDIILTPETALPFFWNEFVQNSSLYTAILDKKVPIWLGAYGSQGRNFTNSLFTVTGTGKIFSRYDKVKLVPLGEYIPFESILGQLIERLSPLDAHLAAGNSHQIFDTPFGRAIVGICYESAFGEHFRRQAAQGGEFIITASNNAHYSKTMPAQHHAQDVMRAIETDRWAARATNTGYSAIVDPRGRTLWISGINTYELHSDIIYQRRTQTLYVQWGNWLTIVLLVLAISNWFLIYVLSKT